MTHTLSLQASLIAGLEELNLDLPVEPFLEYIALLQRWNKAYNLTAVRDPLVMVSRHLLDSLAVLPWLAGSSWLDVGSGAGLPGIPLALARPDVQVTLLDSNGKKTRFLTEVKRALGLSNIEVIQSRSELYRPTHKFDTIISRAFTHISQMIDWTQHLIAPNGIWVAMKGIYPDVELSQIKLPYRVESYTVGGACDARCCVILRSSLES